MTRKDRRGHAGGYELSATLSEMLWWMRTEAVRGSDIAECSSPASSSTRSRREGFGSLRNFTGKFRARLPPQRDRKALQALLAEREVSLKGFAINLRCSRSHTANIRPGIWSDIFALSSEAYGISPAPIRICRILRFNRLLDAYFEARGDAMGTSTGWPPNQNCKFDKDSVPRHD